MATFLPDLPTASTVVTYRWVKALFRMVEGIVNRLTPENFKRFAAAGSRLALAKRTNQHSSFSLNYESGFETTLARVVLYWVAAGAGTVKMLTLRRGAAFQDVITTLDVAVYKNGIGAPFLIGSAQLNSNDATDTGAINVAYVDGDQIIVYANSNGTTIGYGQVFIGVSIHADFTTIT